MRRGRTLALVIAIASMGRMDAQSSGNSAGRQGEATAKSTRALGREPAAVSDAIDVEETRCLNDPAGESTAGMMHCMQRAYEAYDKRLNVVYQRVLHGEDAKSAALIRDSQRGWLAWRKAEAAAHRGPWSAERGTMIGPEIAAENVGALKNRIAELRLYLQD